MKLIVGLGNPEKKYDKTRHNIGFSLLDYWSKKYSIDIVKEKFNGLYGTGIINNEKIIFLKPLSYMNLSGEVVVKFVNYFNVDLNDVMVVQDDLDMELGKFKFSFNHNSGGHNGIKNIIENLNSKKFLRLKIGIGNNNVDVISYVLGKFNADELDIINNCFLMLDDVIIDFVILDRERLLSKYNSLSK